MKNGVYFGIDFGTTNTSVYLYNYIEGKGVQEAQFGTDGKDISPFSSCIALPKDNNKEILFGRYVRDNSNLLENDYYIIKSFKSLLGTDKEIVVNNIRYTSTSLVYLFLKYVKDTVNRDDFKEAVFSIPVDFSPEARKDLMTAALQAGIGVRGFVSESSAAYISKMKKIKQYSKVLVIDWGGGTLDLSILSLKENRIFEDVVHGIKFGGDDIDKELAMRIYPKIYSSKSYDELDPSQKDRLLRNVEKMKIHFSEEDDEYEMVLGPGSKPCSIEYDDFSGIITPLVDQKVIKTILEMMNMANVFPDSIDAVILAGGSSELRPFAEKIKMIFGNDKIIFDDSYQWMVARGAAITSLIDCKFKLSDDLCFLLSNRTVYPILKKDIDGVGSTSSEITVSLTDDSLDAHFIFTDSTGENIYNTVNVQTKGYYSEKIKLKAEINDDQIARVIIYNPTISDTYCVNLELNKLRFYYDLNGIGD